MVSLENPGKREIAIVVLFGATTDEGVRVPEDRREEVGARDAVRSEKKILCNLVRGLREKSRVNEGDCEGFVKRRTILLRVIVLTSRPWTRSGNYTCQLVINSANLPKTHSNLKNAFCPTFRRSNCFAPHASTHPFRMSCSRHQGCTPDFAWCLKNDSTRQPFRSYCSYLRISDVVGVITSGNNNRKRMLWFGCASASLPLIAGEASMGAGESFG
ncbi:hypothetical protein AC579_8288 [Pseudocercospora musae]|uniref:Uncharacterized protein n=1 Tax=Pseudocercospora musae TaxID=113226 RepID=A0A139H0Z3_9PEZI|nr:hypothetical protein AC579_8288 [Pseudocercospora musae]